MAVSKRIISVVPETNDVPEVNYVRASKVAETRTEADDFAKPAEELKAYAGVDSNFKRQVTRKVNTLQKSREGQGGAKSKTIHEKPFLTGYQVFDVIAPPYNLDYLARLANVSAPHMAAVNVKTANIVGLGYKLVENNKSKRNLERVSDDQEKTKKIRRSLDLHRDSVLEELEKMNEDETLIEVFSKVWHDYEVMGNGYLEISRKQDGSIGYLGHIPAQTMRIRRARDGFVQVSGMEVQFFANYIGKRDDEENEDAKPLVNPIGSDTPNEVIHISKYNASSGYYGVPDIVAALQAVAGNDFAEKFNLDYFENKAVPRHVIILKGAKLGNTAENALMSFFETSLKGQNHRTLYIPLPGDTEDNKVELKIEPIEAGVQDASFVNYRRANLSDILMVHRVPVTKISVAEGASLAVARDADKTFKEQVCAPQQKIFEKKFNRVVKELTDAFDFKLNEMSLTDENTQSQIDERRRKTGVETANEQRARRGEPAIEGGDELFDMNAQTKIAEQADATARRGQDKAVEAKEQAAATGTAGANASGNPKGTRQRDTTRSANRTDSAGEARNPKGEGPTTS